MYNFDILSTSVLVLGQLSQCRKMLSAGPGGTLRLRTAPNCGYLGCDCECRRDTVTCLTMTSLGTRAVTRVNIRDPVPAYHYRVLEIRGTSLHHYQSKCQHEVVGSSHHHRQPKCKHEVVGSSHDHCQPKCKHGVVGSSRDHCQPKCKHEVVGSSRDHCQSKCKHEVVGSNHDHCQPKCKHEVVGSSRDHCQPKCKHEVVGSSCHHCLSGVLVFCAFQHASPNHFTSVLHGSLALRMCHALKISCIDEAPFHISGRVQRHNIRENPRSEPGVSKHLRVIP
ncbi:hypothetical protein J6590_048413 [Homalodisca vitripennis]|nr:hypothetical protein J6590_048413 [Homalodisca vitripennis]